MPVPQQVARIPKNPALTSLETERTKLYSDWLAEKTPERAHSLLKSYEPIIDSQLGRFGTSMAVPALRAKARKTALNAVKTYDPTKGAALGTHIVNQLNRLYRDAYESSQALRMSEELQSGVSVYAQAKNELLSSLGREPTVGELRDALGWNQSRVRRIAQQSRGETSEEAFEFDPATVDVDETDSRIDFVYHDLSPRDQYIFEHVTGYGGQPILSKVELAKQLKVTPAVVSQRAAMIAKRMMEGAGLAG